MYYCKDNNMSYYKYTPKVDFGVYQKIKNIDFWQISSGLLSYLFSTLILGLFLIFGYLFITKQSDILTHQMHYVSSLYSELNTKTYSTYMVKSQSVLLEKQEIARIDKILTTCSSEIIKPFFIEKSRPLVSVRTIVVKKGDTLYTLAEKSYGNASHYRLIFDANPKILKSKRDLYIGQVLQIPF